MKPLTLMNEVLFLFIYTLVLIDIFFVVFYNKVIFCVDSTQYLGGVLWIIQRYNITTITIN